MTWYLVAILGYFLYAATGATDKFLLRQRMVAHPLVYTFYIALLSIFTFALAPFGLTWPGLAQFWLAILTGVTLFFSMLFFFYSLKVNEASRALPIIGGLTPVAVLSLAHFFLGEQLTQVQILAFGLLVMGGVLISLRIHWTHQRPVRGFIFIILTILFGGLELVLEKYIFVKQGFITGFIWSRLGFVLPAVLLLAVPHWRALILSSGRQASGGLSLLLVSNKFMVGVGSLLVRLAISRASVSLINALQGTEYVFLLIITIVLSRKFPWVLEEKITGPIILQKTLAIVLIGAGLAILVL